MPTNFSWKFQEENEKGEEKQVEEIVLRNFPNLVRNIKCLRNSTNPKYNRRSTSNIIKYKASEERDFLKYKETTTKSIANFSLGTVASRRHCNAIFKALKENKSVDQEIFI